MNGLGDWGLMDGTFFSIWIAFGVYVSALIAYRNQS